MRRTTAQKTDRSPAPASQTRPKLAVMAKPDPIDERTIDFDRQVDALRIANDYDAIRVKLAEFEREKEQIEKRLIEAMVRSGKTNINTMHGRVSFLPATVGKQVADEKAAVALLEKHGIPQPPTMEAWLAQHRMTMPTKPKEGLPDRVKFELNK